MRGRAQGAEQPAAFFGVEGVGQRERPCARAVRGAPAEKMSVSRCDSEVRRKAVQRNRSRRGGFRHHRPRLRPALHAQCPHGDAARCRDQLAPVLCAPTLDTERVARSAFGRSRERRAMVPAFAHMQLFARVRRVPEGRGGPRSLGDVSKRSTLPVSSAVHNSDDPARQPLQPFCGNSSCSSSSTASNGGRRAVP
jgi:hypothetical protein